MILDIDDEIESVVVVHTSFESTCRWEIDSGAFACHRGNSTFGIVVVETYHLDLLDLHVGRSGESDRRIVLHLELSTRPTIVARHIEETIAPVSVFSFALIAGVVAKFFEDVVV